MPTSSIIRTAARLLDVLSAALIVIAAAAEFALKEVSPSDHGAHFAGARVDRQQRRLELRGICLRARAATPIEIGEHALHIGVRFALHVEVGRWW
jgi:hypothetical protein